MYLPLSKTGTWLPVVTVCTCDFYHSIDAQMRSLSWVQQSRLVDIGYPHIAPCFLKGLDLVCSNGPSCFKISIEISGSRTSWCLHHSSCAKLTHQTLCIILTYEKYYWCFMFSTIWDQYQQSDPTFVYSKLNNYRIWFCSCVILSLSWGFILPAQTPCISMLLLRF